MIKTLQQHGNSRALVIDKSLMDLLGITDETPLQLRVDGQNLIVSPVSASLDPDKVQASIRKMRKRYDGMLKRLAK